MLIGLGEYLEKQKYVNVFLSGKTFFMSFAYDATGFTSSLSTATDGM